VAPNSGIAMDIDLLLLVPSDGPQPHDPSKRLVEDLGLLTQKLARRFSP